MKSKEFRAIAEKEVKRMVRKTNEINETCDSHFGSILYLADRREEDTNATLSIHSVNRQTLTSLVKELVTVVAEQEEMTFEAALAMVTVDTLKSAQLC
jgi:hypothetical protein